LEIHYLPALGLLIIAIGWILQFNSMSKKKKEVKNNFVLAYAVGVIMLIVDGYQGGLYDLAVLNAVALIAALAVYTKLK
jgi:hypothetical protein